LVETEDSIFLDSMNEEKMEMNDGKTEMNIEKTEMNDHVSIASQSLTPGTSFMVC